MLLNGRGWDSRWSGGDHCQRAGYRRNRGAEPFGGTVRSGSKARPETGLAERGRWVRTARSLRPAPQRDRCRLDPCHHADAITAPVSIPLPSPTSHCLARSGRPAAWPPSVRPRRHHADEPRRSLCASKATASSPISVRANTSRRPWRWSSAWATPPNAPPSTTSAIACNDDTIPLRRCGHQDRVCRQFPGRLLVGNPPRQVAGIPRPHRRPASGGAGAR